ncbi:rho GTPase-activating protein gacF-like isoform X2 [Centruroides vittatus]|uniref:rho GTPase-activating protein gacF-like isoform X2 n=1 Tax=Centruroides vittatus TaxID=120091 RepID=UPI003510B900
MKIGEENLQSLIWNELKELGVRLPKCKRKVSYKKDVVYESCPDQVFGVLLSSQEWITVDCHGTPVPRFLAITTEYLLQHKHLEGLFRKVGSITRQKELRKYLENGGNLDYAQPHDVSSLLKQWFRELPEPVIPKNVQNIFLRCYQVDQNISACLLACLLLPPDHLYTLQHTVNFFSNIAKNSFENKMDSHNLALIMAPNLLPSSHSTTGKANKLLEYQIGIVRLLIDNSAHVGQFPSDIAEKLGYHNVTLQIDPESCSNGLEKSDIPDEQPKAKKKRRSGTVQELVSGIRKFVTHGRVSVQTTSEISSNLPPPLVLTSNEKHCKPVNKSASKRKINNEIQSRENNYNQSYQNALSYDILNTEKTNDSLEVTSGLSACDMVSLSDIDSPTGMIYQTPVIQTRRRSLRLLKNKQKKNSIDNSKGYLKISNKNINNPPKTFMKKEVLQTNSQSLSSVEELKEVALSTSDYQNLVQNKNFSTSDIKMDCTDVKNMTNTSKSLVQQNFERRESFLNKNCKNLIENTSLSYNNPKQNVNKEISVRKIGSNRCRKSGLLLKEYKSPVNNVKEFSSIKNIKKPSKSLNKSSLRRGRPNTLKTGLRSPSQFKNNSDSVMHKNTDSYIHIHSSVNDKSCKNIPCNADKNKELNRFEIFQDDGNDINNDYGNSEIDENEKEHENYYFSRENTITKCSTPKTLEIKFNSQEVFLKSSKNSSNTHIICSNYDNMNNNEICFSGRQISPVIQSAEEKENSAQFNQSENPSKSSGLSHISDNSENLNYLKTDVKDTSDLNVSQLTSEKSFNKDDNSNLTEFHSFKNMDISEKDGCTSSDIPGNLQWVSAKNYFSNCEVSTDEHVKRESIIRLRIKNAGMVQANIQRYNSIESETNGGNPKDCKAQKTEAVTPVRIPSIFKRNDFGTRSLHRNIKLTENSNNNSSSLIHRSVSMKDKDHEFKIPTPISLKKHTKTNVTPCTNKPKVSNRILRSASSKTGKEILRNSINDAKHHSLRSSASPIDPDSYTTNLNNSSGIASLDFGFIDEWQIEM